MREKVLPDTKYPKGDRSAESIRNDLYELLESLEQDDPAAEQSCRDMIIEMAQKANVGWVKAMVVGLLCEAEFDASTMDEPKCKSNAR